jgi:hypothetical protein
MLVAKLAELFETEVRNRNGRVVDLVEDGSRLFARSILHEKVEVRRGDFVEGGVALCLMQTQISVRPYVFRLVCTNGAVMAMSDEARTIEVHDESFEKHEPEIKEAIAACASAKAFEAATDGIVKTIGMHQDMGLAMVQLLRSHQRTLLDPKMLLDIIERTREAGTDLFSLMNALTSIARDTPDPERRWKLEEAGGTVPALLTKGVPSRSLEDFEEIPICEPDKVLQRA